MKGVCVTLSLQISGVADVNHALLIRVSQVLIT